MTAMYHQCRLVHADLSEYNLLWHDGQVWVIDVSQSVEIENSNSYEFLLRDCKNICHVSPVQWCILIQNFYYYHKNLFAKMLCY